jgi:ABC-type cobalt transport system substrate-binding protein
LVSHIFVLVLLLVLVLGFISNNEYEYDDEDDFSTKKIKRVAHRNEPPVKGGQNEAL